MRDAHQPTHESTADPEARLYRKGSNQAARLCFMGHALVENRHGLIVAASATAATARAEREAALALIERHSPGSNRAAPARRRQGLRHARLRRRIAPRVRHAARRG